MITVGMVGIAIAVAVFFVVVSLASSKGKMQDEKRARLDSVSGVTPAQGAKSERQSLKERRAERQKKNRLKKQRAATDNPSNKKPSVVQQQLEMVGSSFTPASFTLLKLGLMVALGGAAFVVCFVMRLDAVITLIACAFGAILGMLIPSRILASKVKKRQGALRDALPDTMDLLVVSVEAGLGFDAALTRLYESDKSLLMEEMMTAMRDVQHGMSKKEAYEALAKRCDLKELTSFTNSLIQAEQLGISVKSVLTAQSESLREDRRRRAEEKALKAPVTMMIPMVLFIFPVIFIILMGPAAMSIMETLG